MGFLEKMGLVEREESTVAVEHELIQEPEIDVDVEINSVTNIVSDIYSQNDLSDNSNSIYTVQALIDTLPEEMTTTKKQSTVAGILLVSGKPITNLLSDAERRIDILCSARDKIVEERSREVETANADIEELKKAIESATIRIKEAEEIIEATKQSISDEIKIIDALVEFCNGMEEKK